MPDPAGSTRSSASWARGADLPHPDPVSPGIDYEDCECLDTVTIEVLQLRDENSETWRDKPEEFWYQKLNAEVTQLKATFQPLGLDSPAGNWTRESQLRIISSICLNWLDMLSRPVYGKRL